MSGTGVIKLLHHPDNGIRISKFELSSTGVWTPILRATRVVYTQSMMT